MQTASLTPDGIVTTRLGFGCGGLMRIPSRQDRDALLGTVFDEGVRHFDVSRMYGLGAAEGELGRFAASRRQEITIATKFGIEPRATAARLARFQAPARRLLGRFPALRRWVKRSADAVDQHHRYDAATARASLERSLRELQTDYVDVLLLHGPSAKDTVSDDLAAYLEEARMTGLIRAWGIAGDLADYDEVRSMVNGPLVAQVKADILSVRDLHLHPADSVVRFGLLSDALPRILAHVTASQECRRRWSEAVGADCGDAEVTARLLLRDALESRRDDVVLFATTRSDHVRVGVEAVSAAGTGSDDGLRPFRALVADELAVRA